MDDPNRKASLIAAIGELVRGLQRSAPVAVSMVEAGKIPDLSGEAFEHVLAITREALINAFRHSQASAIDVTVECRWGRLRVAVEDNGCGIPAKILEGEGTLGHWGLLGMRERATELRGRLEIDSAAGRGTSIRLTVPRRSLRPVNGTALRRLFGLSGG